MGIPIMIFGRMIRPLKVLLSMSALAAIAVLATACGTERIKVPKSDASLYRGALLFSERCSGCHTLSYAATNGSATNPRTALVTNGPNLDQRCERPVTRVLYAIANGGFSGAIMPQNVVVGKDAIDVAEFVSKYAGTHAAVSPGVTPCQREPIPEPCRLTGSNSPRRCRPSKGFPTSPTYISGTSRLRVRAVRSQSLPTPTLR